MVLTADDSVRDWNELWNLFVLSGEGRTEVICKKIFLSLCLAGAKV